LGFVLSENTSPVLHYKVNQRPTPEIMSVVFLVPRTAEAAAPFREAIESCFQWRRAGDPWCILPYTESDDGPVPDPVNDPEPPQFQVAVEGVRKAVVEPASRLKADDLWSSVWRSVKIDGAAKGPRHVFLCSSVPEGRVAGQAVIAKARSPRVQIQAFGLKANPPVQDFCQQVGAPFSLVDPKSAGDAIRRAYHSLLAGYEIHYTPAVPGAPHLKIRVQAHGGAGEAIAPYEVWPPAAA
jgi:hypothetical protein